MRTLISTLFVVLMIAGVGIGVYLVQRQQTLKTIAANPEKTRIEFVGENIQENKARSRDISVKLFYVFQDQDSTPSHFRLANSQQGLEFSLERELNQNELEVPWRLSQGAGQKTVYLQFKVAETWQEAVSATINLEAEPQAPSPEFGAVTIANDPKKIPTQAQLDALGIKWLKYVYPCVREITSSECPNELDPANLSQLFALNSKKWVVINKETVPGSPTNASNDEEWTNYIDQKLLPALVRITNSPNPIDAISVWEGADLGGISPKSYAYMLFSASSLIKSINPKIAVISADLGSSSPVEFLLSLRDNNSQVFTDVDGYSFTTFPSPPETKTLGLSLRSINDALLQNVLDKPIWIGAVGIAEYSSSQEPRSQSTYLTTVFSQVSTISPSPAVLIWFSLFDGITLGSNQALTWGLLKSNGEIKDSGQAFASFIQASPAPSPSLQAKQSFDLNLDQKTDKADVDLLLQELKKPASSRSSAFDLNQDKNVNTLDYVLLNQQISKKSQ